MFDMFSIASSTCAYVHTSLRLYTVDLSKYLAPTSFLGPSLVRTDKHADTQRYRQVDGQIKRETRDTLRYAKKASRMNRIRTTEGKMD